jgi:hypothetical protein
MRPADHVPPATPPQDGPSSEVPEPGAAPIDTLLMQTLGAFSALESQELPLDDLLGRVADLSRQAIQADLCLLLLPDVAASRLEVHAVSPRQHVPPFPFESLTLGTRVRDALRGWNDPERSSAVDSSEIPAIPFLHHFKQQGYQSVFAVPLHVLKQRDVPGVCCWYFSAVRSMREQDRLMMESIAHQVSQVLFRRLALATFRQPHLIKCLIDLLQYPAGSEDALRLHAGFIDLDLDRVHCVALIEIEGERTQETGAEDGPFPQLLAERISATYPGSLLYAETQQQVLTCVIDISTGPEVQDWLRDLHLQISGEYARDGLRLFIGVSNAVGEIGDYRRGFVEAGLALQKGYTISPEGGVTHYNDIRIYQYLTVRPDELDDPYQTNLQALMGYDQSHKSAHLLETLDVFLTYKNMLRSGTLLGVHRNTVEQRLRRIKELTGLDVLDDENPGLHFDLALALRVFKLRTLPRPS